jgi:hypothetical protein
LTGAVALGLLGYGVVVAAQPPGFSGTWALDAQRSRIATEVVYAGLIAAGAPPRLHVTQPANGTLVVESEINEGHVRVYTPKAKSTTPVFFQGGTIAMTSKWNGRVLVSEGTQESPSGATTIVKQVRETIALSPDGQTLTIEISTAGADAATSMLVYARTQDVGPCQTWTTPCKGRP